MNRLFFLLPFLFLIQGEALLKMIPQETEKNEEISLTDSEALLQQLEHFSKEEPEEVAESSFTFKQVEKLPKSEPVVIQEEEPVKEEKNKVEIDRDNSQMARILKQQKQPPAEPEAPEGFQFEQIR